MGEWKLIPAGPSDVRSWSFGRIKAIADLYDPKVFGARQNYRCQCGKYSSEDYSGIICDRCGVRVADDASLEHRRRMGHIELPLWCRHPLAESILDEFPICPIAHRTGPDGRANSLGEKYERLVAVCDSTRTQLPPEDSDQHLSAKLEFDRSELDGVMEQIIGSDEVDELIADREPDALLPRLFHAIATVDPFASSLARSCCMSIEIEVTL